MGTLGSGKNIHSTKHPFDQLSNSTVYSVYCMRLKISVLIYVLSELSAWRGSQPRSICLLSSLSKSVEYNVALRAIVNEWFLNKNKKLHEENKTSVIKRMLR